MIVQALLVAFYAAVAHSIEVPVSPWHMAVVVPMSFLVQMLPISRERIRPPRGDVLVLLHQARVADRSGAGRFRCVGAGLVMLFSLSGAAVYVARGT